MFRLVVVFVGVFALIVRGAVVPEMEKHPIVPIVSSEYDAEPNGAYHWSFEGGDGTKQSQEGTFKQVQNETVEVEKGSYSYVGDDGKTYKLEFVADENGFQPKGEHIPTAPPVPPIIAKALAYAATAPTTEAHHHH